MTTSTIGGATETDVNALAVMPCGTPSLTIVMTVTPLGHRRIAAR
jgi:hypothetical protein